MLTNLTSADHLDSPLQTYAIRVRRCSVGSHSAHRNPRRRLQAPQGRQAAGCWLLNLETRDRRRPASVLGHAQALLGRPGRRRAKRLPGSPLPAVTLSAGLAPISKPCRSSWLACWPSTSMILPTATLRSRCPCAGGAFSKASPKNPTKFLPAGALADDCKLTNLEEACASAAVAERKRPDRRSDDPGAQAHHRPLLRCARPPPRSAIQVQDIDRAARLHSRHRDNRGRVDQVGPT